MSLKNKAISSVIWTVIDSFLLKGMSFLAVIFLARWLGPDDFGLMGMIAIFIAIGTSITDGGLSSSLIRTKNPEESDFSTVFILNLFFSIIVYLLLFIISPLISEFFNQPILINIIRIYCLSLIISAFSAVQLARLTSMLDFKSIAKYNLPGVLLSTILGLYIGWMGYGVWSLVWMNLSNQIFKTIVLWFSTNWRPSLKFNKNKAKFHYTYGYRLTISNLMNTIFQYIYNIVIGKFYSVKELGFYERSKSFNDYPIWIITAVVSKVSYPLLVSVSHDKNKLSVLYKKILGITFFVSVPLMFGISAISYPLIKFVLGDEWLEAVPYFEILCFGTMFYPVHAYNLNIFKVFGRSDLFLKLGILNRVVVIFSVLIGIQFGIFGLLWSTVFSSILSLYINTYYSKEMINYSAFSQLKDLFPTYIIGLIMYFLNKILINFINEFNLISQIMLSVFFSLLFYVTINLLIKNSTLHLLINLFIEKIGNK